MNDSLEDLIELLSTEIERLKLDLETFRLTENPNKDRILAELINAIDARQDRLEELQEIAAAMAAEPPSKDVDPGQAEDDSAPDVH